MTNYLQIDSNSERDGRTRKVLENATINKDHLQLYAEDTARGEGN
jgi:hypothetical protein